MVEIQKSYTGRVLEGYGSSYTVIYRKKSYSCNLRGKLRLTLQKTHSPIAVGDRVRILLSNNTGVIEELLPRKNSISRPTKIGVVKEKIIAANVDKLVAIVSAKKPDLKPGLIDRMLLVAEREGVQGVICINKWDLVDKGDLDYIVTIYKKLNYRIVRTNALTGEGIDELMEIVKGSFSVFLGQSGVGKTTILNKIIPGIDRKTQNVSDYNEKGKHTTSYVSAVKLDFGGMIADTPGFRDFGLWNLEQDEIAGLYREFRRYEYKCKYNPCTHYHEPKCGVKEALSNGKISSFRYDNYKRIYESFDESQESVRY